MSNPPTAEAETNLCFDDLTLRQYLIGSADDVLAGRIENHLSDCNACDANLARVEQESSQNSDAFLKSLGRLNRYSNDNPGGADDDARSDLENVVDQIKQLPVDATHANPQPGMTLPGRELGGYELLEPIGRGGMGVVFRANHKRLGKEFAVKVLPADAPNAAGTLDRFRQEVSTAGRLQHDAIVQATDAGEEDGVSFLVMELVEGVDLGFLLKNVGRLDVGCAAEIIRQAAIGLEYAHQQGVIHRDIKPSNLMLDHSGRLRILDFGLAQSNAWHLPHGDLTTVGQLLGTLDYMAPEQADAADSVDHRTDIYSLGATFYCLLAGRAPYAATPRLSPLEKLRLIATQKPAALRAIRDDVPEELDQYVASLLSHDRRDRPMSAAHVAESIAKFSDQERLSEVTRELDKLNRLSRQAVDVPWPPTETSSSPPSSVATESNRSRGGGWISTGLGLLCLGGILAAAIVFAVKLNQGQLVIESEAEVTVSLHKNGKPYDTIEIKPGTQTTKLFADEYQISIASGSDNVSIDNGSFVLKRGEMVVARVQSNGQTLQQDPTQERQPAVNEPLYNGKTLSACLRTVRIERDPALVGAASQGLIALCSDENREEIKNTMLEILLKLDSSRSDVRFVDENAVNVLQNILPDEDRVNLFSALLSGKDYKLINRLLIVLGSGHMPEEYIHAIGSHLTVGAKEHYPETFKRATDKIVNQLARFRSVTASEQLLQSQALDADFWLSVDWIGLRKDGDYPQGFTDALIKRCMRVVRSNRCDARYCMALRQLYGWRNSPQITESFLNELAVFLSAAIVKDDGEFLSIDNVTGTALNEGLLSETPSSRQHLRLGPSRRNRSSTAVLSMLHFVSGLERPVPPALLDCIRSLGVEKRDATSETEDWKNVLVRVQWPDLGVTDVHRPRGDKNLALVKSIRERPASFWYDALVYQAAYTALSRQASETGAPINWQITPNLEPKPAKEPDAGVRPSGPAQTQIADASREITYAGKTLAQCLETIRWERQPELLNAAFQGMSALATDENRERIAKVILETIPKVDGARQKVGSSTFDRIAIRKLETILRRERFNEEIRLLLSPDRPKLASRVVRHLPGSAEIDALEDIARLLDVPECSEQAARSLASLMTHSDINVRGKVAMHLTGAKTKTFWPVINWNGYLTPRRYPQDHYPQSLIDRIAAESAEAISTADKYDLAFCGACINLAYWAKSTPFEEEFLSSLARHVRTLAKNDVAMLVDTPAFAAFEAMPTTHVSFSNGRASRIRMDGGERTYLINPLFAVLSLVRAIDQPLPNDLRDCLQELAASDSLQDVEQVILLRSRFSWPRLNQRVQKRSPVFWHQYFAAREARIILTKLEESAEVSSSDEKP